MDELKTEIKQTIISALQLEDITPEDIVDSEPLFEEGLGLDSIDALELGVALKKKFGIKYSSEGSIDKYGVDGSSAWIFIKLNLLCVIVALRILRRFKKTLSSRLFHQQVSLKAVITTSF